MITAHPWPRRSGGNLQWSPARPAIRQRPPSSLSCSTPCTPTGQPSLGFTRLSAQARRRRCRVPFAAARLSAPLRRLLPPLTLSLSHRRGVNMEPLGHEPWSLICSPWRFYQAPVLPACRPGNSGSPHDSAAYAPPLYVLDMIHSTITRALRRGRLSAANA